MDIVKIQVGIADSAGVFADAFSSRVARFEFSNGKDTFIMADAFPSDEIMVEDSRADGHFVNTLLLSNAGLKTEERELASTVTTWDTLWEQTLN